MLDDPSPLLFGSGKKTGNVFKDDQRNIERIAEADKPGPLEGRIDIQHTREHGRLVRDNPDRGAVQPCKPDKNILRVQFEHVEKLALVNDETNDILHVVRLGGILRYDRIELFLFRARLADRAYGWSSVEVVRRDEAQKFPDREKAFGFVFRGEVSDARFRGVRESAAQVFEGDVLVRD